MSESKYLPKIHTVFGTATIRKDGYYGIVTNEKGNDKKLLHRLIYENFWRIKLPPEVIIHHKDHNKLNNCILNLEAMTRADHNKHHNSGENHPNFGKKASPELLKKLSDSHKGIVQKLESKVRNSKSKNTTGLFRVGKHKRPKLKQGFTWEYRYYENGKQLKIERVDLCDLKKEVESRGLEWFKLEDIDV